jgi:hypothetical protein
MAFLRSLEDHSVSQPSLESVFLRLVGESVDHTGRQEQPMLAPLLLLPAVTQEVSELSVVIEMGKRKDRHRQ